MVRRTVAGEGNGMNGVNQSPLQPLPDGRGSESAQASADLYGAATARERSTDLNPPRWAEAVLRDSLPARDRETVTGDLLEEYREFIVPQRGLLSAHLWYLWQTASLVVLKRRSDMKIGAWLWLTGGIAWIAVIVAVLVLSRFTPPHLQPRALVLPAALIAVALTAIRSAADMLQLWRIARIWTALLVLAAGLRVFSDLLIIFDVEQYFLAQARSGFSELQFPERFAFGASIALILMGAGFHGAWKTAAFRKGVLAALAAALLIAFPLFAIQWTKPDGPAQILVLAAVIGPTLGTAGAMLATGLRGAQADLRM
jgi:hypothetical protein